MRISHEAIYQALYIQGRGALKHELVTCLRSGTCTALPASTLQTTRERSCDARGDDQRRPAEADDRAVPGHWEGDLIIGTGRSAIGTLVERTTTGSPCCCTCREWTATVSSHGSRTARPWLDTAPRP